MRAPRTSGRAALGFSVHTGWAALVAVSLKGSSEITLLDRRRIEMIPATDRERPRFVYHAARELSLGEAGARVQEASARARRNASKAIEAAVDQLQSGGHELVAGVIVGAKAQPAVPLEAILRNHSLLHSAEGALFRGAVRAASEALGLPVTEVASKELVARAARRLGISDSRLGELLAHTGREAGPPWSKDQKDACLAALIVLSS